MATKPTHAQVLAAGKTVNLLRQAAVQIVEALSSPIVKAFFESKKDIVESMILGEIMIRIFTLGEQEEVAKNNIREYTKLATAFWKFVKASTPTLPSDEEMGRLIADYADIREAFSLAADDILNLDE